MSNEETYTLGATAPSLELIRDMLRSDYDGIKRDMQTLKRNVASVNLVLEGMEEKLEMMEEVALTLIDDTLKGNANNEIRIVKVD
jgi:hypothetical protein